MARVESALQQNNGGPRGYGQPARPRRRGRDMDEVLLREEERQVFGEPEPLPGRGQPPSIYPPQLPPGGVQDPRATDTRTGLGVPQQGQASPLAGLAQGDAARGALAQYGTGNIQGAGGLKTGGFMGQLEGFNTQGWGTGERGTESIKNSVGRLMSRYDVTQPGASQALTSDPEFRQLFPMARVVEHPNGDLIDFGDGNGPVDVIRGAVAGGSGAAWQWGANPGPSPLGGPGGPGAQAYMAGIPTFQPSPNQTQPVGQPGQMPQVNDEQTAMEFLNWLMTQQPQLV